MRAIDACNLVLLGIVVLVGCASHTFEVTREANPNPFTGSATYAVHSIEYENLQVSGRPEVEFLASKSEETDKWTAIKSNVNAEYRRTLEVKLGDRRIRVVPENEPAQFHIRAYVGEIEPGSYGVTRWDAVHAQIVMNVKIGDSDGSVLDEIVLSDSVPASALETPTANVRLKKVATSLGLMTARHLLERIE